MEKYIRTLSTVLHCIFVSALCEMLKQNKNDVYNVLYYTFIDYKYKYIYSPQSVDCIVIH
jgi:hypothetical protein